MKIIPTSLNGLYIIEPNIFKDIRGSFIKTYTDDFFQGNGLNIEIKESYYSISHKGVIRGMHFQTPPYDHTKLVYVPNGKVLDVIVDIRQKSPTFGEFFSLELSSQNGKILLIPQGMAHGFLALEDNTNVTYLQTSCYAPEHDCGIYYDSFGFDWGISNPKLSERDLSFCPFGAFSSPFIFGVNS